MYEICFKKRVFFLEKALGYKNDKGIIKNLKIQKIKK